MVLLLELFPILIIACCGIYVLLIMYFKWKPSDILAEDEKNPQKISVEDEKKVKGMRAVVRCSPDRIISSRRMEYPEMIDCRLFKEMYKTEIPCEYGCLGYGTCALVCPQKAIIIHNETAIVTDDCIGCGKCVESCPQKIIQLIPLEKEYYIQCAAVGKETGTTCSTNCATCGQCQDDTPLTLELANRCPNRRIQKIAFPYKKSFKFLHLWYTMFHINNNSGKKK